MVAPHADICYFADARWWKWHSEGIVKKWPWIEFTAEQQLAAWRAFPGAKVTIENTGMMVSDPEVFMLHNGGRDGLSERANALHTGSNGGYQALNLAVLTGAKRIALLGYDMRFPGGRSHSHNGHPIKIPEAAYNQYAKNFSSMLPQLKGLGVEVINCTPGSAIGAFRKASLESILRNT